MSTPSAFFYGLTTIDLQFMIETWPNENTKNKAEKHQVTIGGPSTNASIVFSHLGGRAHLFSVCGNHYFSDMIRGELKNYNVSFTDLKPDSNAFPTFASVLTNAKSGDRTIFSYSPVCENTINEFFTGDLFDVTYDVIMVDGFFTKSAISFIEKYKKPETIVVLDGGSWKFGMEKMLPLVDIAIVSEEFKSPFMKKKEHILDYLQREGISQSAVTMGSKPLLYNDNGCKGQIVPVKIDAVDTLGAGDFFHGAFCYYYSQNKKFIDSLDKAKVVAAQSCKFFGTREWMTKH